MKITIEKMEIESNNLDVVLRLKANLEQNYISGSQGLDDRHIQHEIVKFVSQELGQKIILDRGAKIMNELSNNQIINAVLMKVAGNLGRG